MNFFSYVVEHDYGLAPNPFGGYCTLAVCKPGIRKNKNLKIGDWIIGTGSKKLNRLNHLIYAMKVEEKITFEEYWNDRRFRFKRPIVNGSLVQMYGDNFYHKDEQTQEWIQEAGIEQPSSGFVHSVMDAIELNAHTSKVYRPLISKRGWSLVAALFVASLVLVYFFPLGEFRYLETIEFSNLPSIQNPFEGMNVSKPMVYAVGFLALFLVQIPFLKRKFIN